ncbi:isocitrate lyase/phosphoenolpyruvate mutase family protein [Luteimonas sp. RD2P54]|uniref:Isocitrate lyase/phosphoenolpyruvate mutase family protein n=1 Tax=Luteimonas endophytica TaxID=3042023 RepID=A0ABT6JEA1_9GAMM|nr:isocitrate lyase/phosphoenolpyruvate mutase family protein [Luteimonas endophytica]MDH5824885.1 isocitrate lyase/phosphoenolpyruvate mutase family protein [Luteimonas endophytica]
MPNQKDKARLFRSLHAGERPLLLFNVWDAGSAKVVADAGADALATASWAVAASHGLADGEQVPLQAVLDNLTRIVAATDLPVSLDLESGYGRTAAAVGLTVERAIAAGAVGCNLEDSRPEDGALRDPAEQAERLAEARRAAETSAIPLFINARTDVFFARPAEDHDASMVEDALRRAELYAKAGADGLFVPNLTDVRLIETLARASPLPVNIMAGASAPAAARLAGIGVARISHGPGPYLAAMRALAEAARAALAPPPE